MLIVVTLLAMVAVGLTHALRGHGIKGFERWTVGIVCALAFYGAAYVITQNPTNYRSIIGALLVGAGVTAFLSQSWGRWHTFARLPREASGPPVGLEKTIEGLFGNKQSAGNDALCWLVSAFIFALPLIVFGNLVWAVLAPVMVVLYYVAWQVNKANAIRTAELLSGALIGALSVAHAALPNLDTVSRFIKL